MTRRPALALAVGRPVVIAGAPPTVFAVVEASVRARVAINGDDLGVGRDRAQVAGRARRAAHDVEVGVDRAGADPDLALGRDHAALARGPGAGQLGAERLRERLDQRQRGRADAGAGHHHDARAAEAVAAVGLIVDDHRARGGGGVERQRHQLGLVGAQRRRTVVGQRDHRRALELVELDPAPQLAVVHRPGQHDLAARPGLDRGIGQEHRAQARRQAGRDVAAPGVGRHDDQAGPDVLAHPRQRRAPGQPQRRADRRRDQDHAVGAAAAQVRGELLRDRAGVGAERHPRDRVQRGAQARRDPPTLAEDGAGAGGWSSVDHFGMDEDTRHRVGTLPAVAPGVKKPTAVRPAP